LKKYVKIFDKVSSSQSNLDERDPLCYNNYTSFAQECKSLQKNAKVVQDELFKRKEKMS